MEIFKRMKRHFMWSKWKEVGEQVDEFRKRRYLILEKTNKNGLKRYTRVLKAKSSCHADNLRIVK